ncbi:MAG: hypothetical protein RJA44_362 [Pseudomonadota bacterium]|jgi:ribosome-associated protein
MHDRTEDFDDELSSPSKTQLKKQMHELQTLGKDLSEMPDHRLKPLNLPEELLEALRDYRRTRSHEGRRRQLQYLGKLMRRVDPAPLREAVASWRVPGARETLALHEAERWRDRLIGSDNSLTEWLDRHPGADVQQLRTLIRNARKEASQAAAAEAFDGAAERKGRAYRELFQHVRQALQAAAAPTDSHPEEEDHDD